MTFVDASLSAGETVHGRYALHWINTLPIYGYVLLAAQPVVLLQAGLLDPMMNAVSTPIVSGVCVGLSALALLYAVIVWLGLRMTELAATNKRVIKKTGIIGRDTEEMKLASIETVTLSQSLLGRALNYGNLRVTGKGVSDVAFNNVSDPVRVKRSIENIDTGLPHADGG